MARLLHAWIARFEPRPLPGWFGRLSLGAGVVLVACAILTLLAEREPSDAGYVIVFVASLVAGLLNLRASMRWVGRERLAWMGVGSGALFASLGYLLGAFLGFPDASDFTIVDGFFLATYVVVVTGTLFLPYQGGTRVERLRTGLDAAVGVAAGVALAWPLAEIVTSRPGALKGVLFLVADAFILTAVVVVAVRRSAYRTDLRVAFVGLAFLANLVGDISFILDEATRVAVPMWIGTFGLGSFLAWAQTRPVERWDAAERVPAWWRLAVPYALALALIAVVVADVADTTDGNWFSAVGFLVVVVLVIARQSVAIRENRQLVERERDALVSSVSHELRTPLTAIVGFLQVVESGWEAMSEEERRELVRISASQSEHLERIVGDLVQIARGRLERTELRLGVVDLEALLREAVTVADAPVTIDVRSGARVLADRARLRQVVINLLTNAVRYGGGKIRLVLDVDRSCAMIEVHDDGVGVPEAYRDVIFDRFERGAQRLLSTVPGSGIGLAIARALVSAHGGSISYRDSEIDGGACFSVRLPLLDERLSDAEVRVLSQSPAR